LQYDGLLYLQSIENLVAGQMCSLPDKCG